VHPVVAMVRHCETAASATGFYQCIENLRCNLEQALDALFVMRWPQEGRSKH